MIREMKTEDIPGVLQIEKTLLGRQWTGRAFEESLQQDYTFFYVEENADHSIAGYLCIERLYGEAELVNVAVHPQQRRTGMGARMLREAIEKEKEAGTESIVLEVRKGNLPAIRMYEQAGFAQIGVRKNFYEFPVEDAIVMQLPLKQN
jgi:ribosomal-protein-alanine N-acetyltransferase